MRGLQCFQLAPHSPAWQSCSPPLQAMHTAPSLGTQQVHAAIEQAATVYSQTPLKCFVGRPLESVKVCAGSIAQKVAESGKSLLKELWHATSKHQEAVLNSVYFRV